MYKRFLLIIVASALLGTAWAGTSANYKIATEVLDSGAASGRSGSYQLLGKTRDKELQVPSSYTFVIGEGFLRTAYIRRAIFGPLVTAVTPSSAPNTRPVSLTVSGANFVTGAAVKLSKADGTVINATGVVVASAGKITCTVDITGAKGGLWTVTVTNPDNRSGSLPDAFRVNYPPPTLASVVPDKGVNNATVNVTIAGTNFRAGATLKLLKAGEGDIIGERVAVASAEKITGAFNLTKKAPGLWDLTVTNDDGQFAAMYQSFKVEAPGLEVLEAVRNVPNPFDPKKEPTIISYTLSQDSNITIDIFNIRGERIWQYQAASGKVGGMAGYNAVGWNGVTAFKSYAGEGVYFLYVSGKVDGQTKVLSRTKVAITK